MSAQRLHRRAAKKSAQQQAQQQQKQQRRKIGQYDHAQNRQRLNNPPAGIAHMGDTNGDARAVYEFDVDANEDPKLHWNGKIRRSEILLPTVPHSTLASATGAGAVVADNFALFQRVLDIMSPAALADRIGLHKNTVTRWIEQCNAPSHYRMDFLRILGKPVLGQGGDLERELDMFFTKPAMARECFKDFTQEAKSIGVDLRQYHHIEPSAGDGCFIDLLPCDRRIALDLIPRHEEILKADFLTWEPPAGKRYVVVGNPPFGLRGHLALQFINHAANFADLVAFILPQLFESDGKGAPMKRVDKRLSLAFSKPLPPDSFERPDGKPTAVNTVFQVWAKGAIPLKPPPTCDSFIRIYSLSDGGTPSSTRNKDMIGKCDVYLPSTCYAGMRAYSSFAELPNQRGYGVVVLRKKREVTRLLLSHDWRKTAFPSTNSALNLRSGLIRRVITNGGYCDES